MRPYVETILNLMEKAFEEENGEEFYKALGFLMTHSGELHRLPELPDLTWVPTFGRKPPSMDIGTFAIMLRGGVIQASRWPSEEFRWSHEGSASDIIAFKKLPEEPV